MDDVAVIDDPVTAGVSLDPIRARLLAELVEPGSASSLAPVVGLSRQKVNYHLRTLESHGLVTLVEERRKGNMTERVLRATAAAYVISPAALPGVAPDPERAPDQLSAHWLLSLCSRSVGELGELLHRSTRAGRPLATFAADASIDFATAADRAYFAAELSDAVEALVAKYHRAEAPGGRRHRLLVGLHPQITRPDPDVPPDRADPTTHSNRPKDGDNQ
jgi:DNA-binding transcriptional ArsR family regulator